MATTTGILTKMLSGQLGRQIVFKQYSEKTVVSKYPDMSKRKLSTKQKKLNLLMKEANAEAHRVMADEQLRMTAQVRLNVTSNRLYRALISEYIKGKAKG